jgi:hypothetical protein
MALQSPVGQDLLIHEVSHTTTQGLLWTSFQLVAETSTWQHNNNKRQAFMPPLGLEPTISAGERP